ncbi:MAG: DUF2304 domain-containing protein [Gammaproteobacteria bacterium]|nr:DUF2304 domain-containing protein [Gammaproteobacteria bacterium]
MISSHWTSAVIAVAIAATIIWLVRRNHLHPRNAAWWISLAVVIAFIGMFPLTVDWIAVRLGVDYPPVLAVILGLAVILLKMLKTDIERTRDQQQIRILAQKVAVLEAQLERGSSSEPESVTRDRAN